METPRARTLDEDDITLALLNQKLDEIARKVDPVAQLCSDVRILNAQINDKDGLRDRVGKVETKVEVLDKKVTPWIKVLSIVAVILATTLVAFIWAILIHQVTIMVPV